jgi:hypothetical protein
MSENKMTRVILGLARENAGLTGISAKLHNEELHDLHTYKTGEKIREDQKAKACTIQRKDKCTETCKIKGKEPLGIPRHK